MTDLLAAFLRAQLEHRDQIQSRRREIWEAYSRELTPWAEANGLQPRDGILMLRGCLILLGFVYEGRDL